MLWYWGSCIVHGMLCGELYDVLGWEITAGLITLQIISLAPLVAAYIMGETLLKRALYTPPANNDHFITRF